MKKIFLIPLLTLLCTVMAWGVTEVNVGTEAELREALANASGETRINLTANIRGTKAGNPANAELAEGRKNGSFIVPSAANIVLNLAEYSLSAEAPTDGNAEVQYFCTLYIKSGATVRIVTEGTGMVISPCKADNAGFCIGNEGDLTINGGIFLGQTVGEEVGVVLANAVLWNQSGGSAVINGGTFILAKAALGAWNGIITPGASLTVNGGRFSSAQVGTSGNISSYLGDGCTMEQVAFSESYASWVNNVYLVTSAASSGITYAADETIEENVETTDVLVKAGVTVTLKKDHKITCDNLAFEDGTAQLIIEAGAAVIVNDEVTAPSVNNIHMTMDGRDNGDGNSYLLIKAGQNQETHPNATVVLKSKAYKKANGQNVFQRFAVPTHLGGFRRDSLVYNHEAAPTAIYRWDYATETWKSVNDDETFEPFHGYNMTTLATAPGQEYTFKARLVGNGNAELPLQGHWNCYANSYTAPVDIATVISDLYDNYDNISSSVYVHHAEGDYWDQINVAQVIRNKMLQKKIEPMQAFVLERLNTEGENPIFNYSNYIYNPFMGIQPNNAPKRNAPVQLDFAYATMKIEAADGSRNTMEMYEGYQFDASFDNGFDVAKYMNENSFNMYFVAQEGNMAYLASDNLANTAITLETKEATSYTINFADVTMEGYVLRDNLTGTETEIISGNTYSFSAPANSKIEGRFEIVADAKMPTAIEDVEVNANVKGIYTLTGQYMGENFHALPAGVYVINGKKVVK